MDSNSLQSHQLVDLPLSSIQALAHFHSMVGAVFFWGFLDGSTCVSRISECYDEAIHWKPNIFRLPAGRAEENFVKELTCLFNDYANVSALESVAIKAAHLLPLLVLQRSDKLNNSDRST